MRRGSSLDRAWKGTVVEYFEWTIRIPKPGRRWLRFRLRTVLLTVTVLCMVFGYLAHQRDQNRRKATAYGKYSHLLCKISVPEDQESYGAFYDWGWWDGTVYAGETNLPPGHWVYVAPDWYIWRDSAVEDQPPARTSVADF